MEGPVDRLAQTLESPFEIRPLCPHEASRLLAMYDRFEPKRIWQGLPPEEAGARRRWLEALTASGVHLVGWHGEEVAGHLALLPDPARGDAELLIFVHQEFRRKGLGRRLAREALKWACAQGLACVWLTVETYNQPAVRLYQSLGFQSCDKDPCERMMVLRIQGGGTL